MRCLCILATLAAQGLAIYIVIQHEPALRARLELITQDIRAGWERMNPKPLRGKLWDDVAEAMRAGGYA